ncbi:MAG: polynucleotide adenylyltransferase PcnB [Gammaproteobacteria bacterium]|nr:polynucleotide adenylyltransferase PcnB [Gammaproteobacteria bacterium]
MQTLQQTLISINAIKVLERLQDHGYEAYLVGGSVRDILLGEKPKDFDIATNAHPEEVRHLFRNARLIGRRFKIVHVRFGQEIVEVATFRAGHNAVELEEQRSNSGMILSDNIYGTFEEDAIRRDFSINALYYDPRENQVKDLVGGLEDISKRCIRLIGDAEGRLREDPVRMIRAIRFAARLEFSIAEDTARPMNRLGHLIQDVSSARLFDEILKVFLSGHGVTAYELMKTYEFFQWLFPATHRVADTLPVDALLKLALASTDSRIQAGKPVTPAFLLAALLWYPFLQERQQLIEAGKPNTEAFFEAASSVIHHQQIFTSIPRRFTSTMRDMWHLQFRLPNRGSRRAEALLNHKRFRAAYDFLLLREEAGELEPGLGEWWTTYQEADNEEKASLMKNIDQGRPKRHRRGNRRRKKPGNTQDF